MQKILVSLLFASFFFAGCATILSPRYQDVTVKTNNKNAVVFADSVEGGKGTEVKVEVKKDNLAKQIIVQVDSCKSEYRCLVQDHRSPLYYMSIIPFAIFIYPPLYDIGPNTWNFDDEIVIDKVYKYDYWNESLKRVYLKNIAFDVKKDKHFYALYTYGDYLDKDDPYKTEKMDSLKFKNSVYEDALEESLQKTGYSDTTNTVFMDNINTLMLRCVVEKISYNEIIRSYMNTNHANFATADIVPKWIVEDVYGDTLYTESFPVRSGEFSLTYYKPEAAIKNTMNDAMELSMMKLFESKNYRKLLFADTNKTISFPKMTIPKPTKAPTNIEDAMKAVVTIKNDSWHGSGFLISNDGYIITNHHVVTGTKKFTVINQEGKKFDAKIIRSNKLIDLALIKIEGNFEFAFNLPTDKNFKTGQEVFAIGTPKSIELGQSVSKGIVSNLRKHNEMNYVQTDVSVNRGNSGGAICSSTGDLIGVVEFKVFGQGVEGLSFAIPGFDVLKSLSLNY